MRKVEIQIPEEVMERIDRLAAKRGSNYVSVNSDEISGRDALLTDLLILGLDDIDAGESEFPDDVDND